MSEINMPADTRLAYYLRHEQWYYDAIKSVEDVPSLVVCADAIGGGVAWEFTVEELDFNTGRRAARVCLFDDAFRALRDIAPFFAHLAEHPTGDLSEVRGLLDELGAVDITERTMPSHLRETA